MHLARFFLRLVAVLALALPLIWMVGAALHPPGEPLPRTLRLLPEAPSFENFRRGWAVVPMTRYTINSLVVVALPLLARRGRAVLVSLACLVVVAVAVSRVLLGMHFPSDVVGAVLLGLLVALAAAPLAGTGWAAVPRPDPEDVATGPLPVIRLGRRLPPRPSGLRLVPGSRPR